MKKTFIMLGLVAAFLAVLDVGVAAVLHWAEEQGRMGSLVRYCIDPVKTCSCYKGERSNEYDDGRQHQTLDGEA